MPTYLFTSSDYKLKEFKSFCSELPKISITALKGPDLPEVLSDSITVSIYKTFDSLKNTLNTPLWGRINSPTSILCEDTILCERCNENWEEVVDIKWKLPTDGASVMWRSILGEGFIDPFRQNYEIRLYIGEVTGHIILDTSKEGEFGFERFFYPDGQNKNLAELALTGEKNLFSARKRAFDLWVQRSPDMCFALKDIEPWDGKYQNELIGGVVDVIDR